MKETEHCITGLLNQSLGAKLFFSFIHTSLLCVTKKYIFCVKFIALLYKTFNCVQGYFQPRTDRTKSTYIHLADKVSMHRVNFTPEVPGRGRILRKAKLP